MSWFEQKIYKLVEVEKPRTYSALEGEELKASLHSLNGHPGFRYLLERLKTQRALLKQRLETSRHKSMEDVTFLQQGVLWSGWLDAEFARLTAAPQRPQVDPVEQELLAFKELSAMLESVGD